MKKVNFKFSPDQKDLIKKSISDFENETVKSAALNIFGAYHGKAHVSASWTRSS